MKIKNVFTVTALSALILQVVEQTKTAEDESSKSED